ncbi:MAG: sulfotransferase [Aestuariibacter sp.]
MQVAQESLSDAFQTKIRQFQQRIQQQPNDALLDDIQLQVSEAENTGQKIELLYLMVVTQRILQRFQDAITSANALLALHSEHARTYQELGHIQLALGQNDASAAGFQKAVQFNPTLLASWKSLEALSNEVASVDKHHVAEQIKKLAQLPKQLFGAMDLFYEGKLYLAEQVCRLFLQNNKHHPDAMLLLADIGIQLKIYGEAEFLLESCVELYPEHLEAREKFLFILSKTGKFEQASQQADALLAMQPEETRFQVAKATALVGIGDIEPAINIYESVIQSNTAYPGIYLLLGHAYKALGDRQKAIESYQKAYHLAPQFGDAFWSLANTKTYRFSAAEITQMEQQLDENNPYKLRAEDIVHFHFALAKAFEDTEDYDKAFYHYQQGNKQQESAGQYSPDMTHRQVTRQKQYCTASLFAANEGHGHDAPDPIFITGLPRSGSTLLEQILASHSMIDGTMELHNILGFAARLTQSGYPENLSKLPEKTRKAMGQAYIEQTRVYRQDAPFFIDKMPNNFLHIGLIKLILPKAKIIDARRHPMACCFSGYKQLFAEGQDFSYNLEHIARYYQDYVSLMNHWHQVLPGQILTVKHEDVVADLPSQLQRMLDYLGLPFEQQCLSFYETKRLVKTPSSEQVRQPIYQSGLEQWKHFSGHLSGLEAQLKNEIERY